MSPNTPIAEKAPKPWSMTVEQTRDHFGTEIRTGLSADDVERIRERVGENRLREARRTSIWELLFRQLKSVIMLLLVGAAVLSAAFGQYIEAAAVLVVIVLNTAIGFMMEFRAEKSMQALRRLSGVHARVRRDGKLKNVSAVRLVPGDVVLFEAGDVAAADVRVVESNRLMADESPLTGESVPVQKTTDAVDEDTPLAERTNMVFKGTSLVRGTGTGIVIGTGMDTELGSITELVDSAEKSVTPLQRRLDLLGRRLVWLTLAISVFVALSGILRGRELFLIIETAIALAVATVPEGLPVVASLAMGRDMLRLAQKNALVKNLASVETLGSTGVIITDKTGTLTENRMRLTVLSFMDHSVNLDTLDEPDEAVNTALTIAALCNNAELSEDDDTGRMHGVGEPMEAALAEGAHRFGVRRRTLTESMPEVREVAFDADTLMMATVHDLGDGNYRYAVKGAPEAVIQASAKVRIGKKDHKMSAKHRDKLMDGNRTLAEGGLRNIALAEKVSRKGDENPYEGLVFIALAGLQDPPRIGVKEAVAACRSAGIRVVMATGDHPATAASIAEKVGLAGGGVMTGAEMQDAGSSEELIRQNVFARVSPADKLDMIDLHQRDGSVVAMTGDGVNDAPALKKADIGITMGKRGTQVAAEAADVILQDDEFSTIVTAVRHGRVIFKNIRKFISYLLAIHVSEVLVVGAAAIAGLTLPILPLQILFLNLVTDVFPALALGLSGADPGVMKEKPRPAGSQILNGAQWRSIMIHGVVMSVSVLASLVIAQHVLGYDTKAAVTVSFLTLAFSQLWHVFTMKEPASGIVVNEVTKNRWVWYALVLCISLLLLVVYVPGFANVLRVIPPDADGWLVVMGASIVPLTVWFGVNVVRRLFSPSPW